jgi:hypothetical protein
MNLDETTNKQRTCVFIALAAAVLGLILMACGGSATALTVPGAPLGCRDAAHQREH